MNRNKRFFNLARKLEIQRSHMKNLDEKIQVRKVEERMRMISPFDTGMPSEGGQPSLSLGRLHHARIGFSGAYTTTNAYAEAQHNQFSFRSGQSPRGNALSQQAASTGVMSGVLPTVESDQRRENRPLNLMYSSKVIQ